MTIAVGSFGFSIRAYSARMRSVDYDKCWPFPEERAGRPLPPMPVPRSRWWVDELRASSTDGWRTEILVDPVDKSTDGNVVSGARDEHMLRSVRVVTAVDGAASAEEKLMRTPFRAKQRTPKKRSILELFAVSPPIHRGGKEQGEEPTAAKSSLRVDDGEELELMTRSKEGGKMVRNTIGVKKKLKVRREMMKKKNNLKVEICAAKKEKAILFKRSSLDGFCKILKNEVYELFRKMHKKFIHNQLKPAIIRTIVQRRVYKLVHTSNVEFKNLEEESLLPAHAWLHKNNVVASNKKKKEGIMKGDELLDLVCEPSRYVNSSSLNRKHVNSSGIHSTARHDNTCLPLARTHFQSVESDGDDSNELKSAKLSLNDKRAKLSMNEEEFVTSFLVTGKTDYEKQVSESSGHVTATEASSKYSTTWAEFDLNHPLEEHIDLNSSILDESTLPPSPRCLDDQKVTSPRNNVEFDCDQRINQDQIFSFRSDQVNTSCIYTGVSTSVSNATSARGFSRNWDKKHWMHCSDQRGTNLSERQTHSVGPMKDVSNRMIGFYAAPNQLVANTYSSFQSKAVVDPSLKTGQMLGDICTVKDFVGLPLNSQGEHIQLHPGNRYDFHEADKMPNTASNSLQHLSSARHIQLQYRTKCKFPCASCHEDDQHYFLNHCHGASKLNISDLGPAGFHDKKKLKFQPRNCKAQVNSSYNRQWESLCRGSKDYIETECFNKMRCYSERDLKVGIPSEIHPTMRLMGTNVPIGSYSKDHKDYNAEKIWIDTEINMGCCPTTTRVFDGAISRRWQDEDCILRGDSVDSREVPFQFSSCSCTSADKLESIHMHPGLGSNGMLEDCNSSSTPHGYDIDNSRSPVPCQSFLKKESHCSVHCIPETQSEKMDRQEVSWASYSHNFCHHTISSPAHYRPHQGVSNSIRSACHPCYTNQVPAQTSRGLSLQEIPHWLQNTTSQESHFMPCHLMLAYQSCTVPQDTNFPYASCRNPVVYYPSGGSSVSQTYGSYALAPYSSSTADLRKDNVSLMSSTYGYNIRARDGAGINYSCEENQHYSKKCRKRPASGSIKIMETVKRPNLKLSVEREQLHGKQEDNVREFVINYDGTTKKDIRLPDVALDRDNVVVSGGVQPLRSSHLRSGPIKLSAGAKHILRPKKILDQENSSPIYVSIPFTQGTSTGKHFVTLEEVAEATKV